MLDSLSSLLRLKSEWQGILFLELFFQLLDAFLELPFYTASFQTIFLVMQSNPKYIKNARFGEVFLEHLTSGNIPLPQPDPAEQKYLLGYMIVYISQEKTLPSERQLKSPKPPVCSRPPQEAQ